MADRSDTDALIAAHLDGSLAPADAQTLHERLRTDADARRALVISATQASIFARGALEQPTRRTAPRRRTSSVVPWLAVAAGIAAAAGPIWWLASPAPERTVGVDGPVTAMRGGSEVDLGKDHWLRTGDHLRVGNAPARLRWADEATEVILDPDTELDLVSTRGAKKLLMSHGRLVAAVAPQPATAGFSVTTPRGDVNVVGTHFDVRSDGRATAVHVDKGTVQVVPSSGAAPARVEAGFDAVCDEAGLRVSSATAPAPTPSGPDARRAVRCDATSFTSYPERLGEVKGSNVVGVDCPNATGAVSMIQFGATHGNLLPLSGDFELRTTIEVDRPTTVAICLVYEDSLTWMGNVQAERVVTAGKQDLVFHRGDFTLRAGRAAPADAPARLSLVALMTWGPVAHIEMSAMELRASQR